MSKAAKIKKNSQYPDEKTRKTYRPRWERKELSTTQIRKSRKIDDPSESAAYKIINRHPIEK